MDFKELFLILAISFGFICGIHAACQAGEQLAECDGNEICYGGTSGITPDDVICILTNGCNMTLRKDVCQKCDAPLENDVNGTESRYKDCFGECHEDKDTMAEVDGCGVCGGNDDTCSPIVTDIDLMLIPTTNTVNITVTGAAFLTPNIQILQIQRRTTQYTMTKTVLGQFVVNTIFNSSRLEIMPGSLEAGKYEIGARTGDVGTEYIDPLGPILTVYDESNLRVSEISPDEQDIDGTVSVPVQLTLRATGGIQINKLYEITNKFTCIVRDSDDTSMITDEEQVDGNYVAADNSVICVIPIPEENIRKYICVSLNSHHVIGCKYITFFVLAPAPIENKLLFDETGTILSVDFDVVLGLTSDMACSQWFDNITILGSEPLCRMSGDKRQLQVTLGAGASIVVNDTITLRGGLRPVGTFYRVSVPVDLTVTSADTTANEEGGSTIEIAPRGAWQTFFSAFAAETALFELQIVKSAGSRGAKSIVWKINDVVSESFTDMLYLNIYVPEAEGNYTITVKAVDYMNGEATITHTFEKRNINLPDISFSPLGVTELGSSLFRINPNTEFIINTHIMFRVVDDVGGPDDYIFTWKLNGEVFNEGKLYYRSNEADTTIEECNTMRTYSLSVAHKTNINEQLTYSILFVIKCRNPVAVITGSREINLDTEHGIYEAYGIGSYDPDGGQLTYKWWCETLGDDTCIYDIIDPDQNITDTPTIAINSKAMVADKTYVLKLKVTVEKSDGNYSNTDKIYFHAKSGDTPVVRMVTIRTKFRRDKRIMIKAHVGDNIKKVKWRFVDGLAAYDWLDALNKTIGTQTDMGEYSWFTINPNIVAPGRRYRLEAEAISESRVKAKEYHNVYAYRLLAGCKVDARPMAELQESSFTVRDCLGDSDVTWTTLDCRYDPIRIQLSPAYKFITPIFPDDVTNVYFNCTITDNLGHTLNVRTNEVSVNKATPKEIDQARSNLRQTGKNLDALNLIADMTAFKRIVNDRDISTEAVAIVQEVMSSNPDVHDMKRVLLSYSRLDINSIRPSDLKILLRHIKAIASELCKYKGNYPSDILINEDVEEILKTSANLARTFVDFRKDYNQLVNKLMCIKMKRMKNEDTIEFNMDNGAKHTYLVNALDDLDAFNVHIDFPEQIRSRYRDTWKCGNGVLCHGVGLKVEEYDTESPDLAFNRKDKECARYISVGLYNQHSGYEITVKDLEDVINIKFNVEGCPRPECWYFDTVLERFDQSGVFSNTDENGTFYCQSKHLTSFTIRSAPEVYNGKNIPYIISITVGSILLVVSLIVLIKAFLSTKRRANSIEDNKDPLPEHESIMENSPPPSYQMTVSRDEWRKY